MVASPNQILFEWMDCNGKTAQNYFNVPKTVLATDTNLADLITQAQANSNATLWRVWYCTAILDTPATPGTAADYRDAFDFLAMLHKSSGGKSVQHSLIAPKANLFLADGTTLDQSGPLATYLAKALAIPMCDSAGHNVNRLYSGLRKRLPGLQIW